MKLQPADIAAIERATLATVSPAASLREAGAGGAAELMTAPDEAWQRAFGGEGFDAADAASRVRAFGKAGDALYAALREGEAVLATGIVSFSHGWAGVHGMRTLVSRRGQGLAGRVLKALGEAALARGHARVFLQVEEGNAAARALYARAGFKPAWRYAYWRPRPA